MFLERVEIVVAVEEVMPLGQTESGDQAIDGLADRMAAGSKRTIVLSGGHSQCLTSGVEHLEVRQVTPDAREG